MDIIFGLLKSIPYKDILGPLFGSWFGAWFAFKYDRDLKTGEKVDTEVEQAKYAQFVLISHIHMVDNIWNGYLKNNVDNPTRHLDLKRFDFNEATPLFNFEKLSFLLDNIAPQILYDLYVHERKYFNFIDAIKTRNEFYNQHWKEEKLKQDEVLFVEELTDNIYSAYERIKQSNDDSYSKLLSSLKAKYPAYNFPSIENED